jgi:hypothetical protein
MENELSIQLVDYKGYISQKVYAYILDNGNLQLAGWDTGDIPSGPDHDDDVEYWIDVPADCKKDVRKILLEGLQEEKRLIPEGLFEEGQDDKNLLKLILFVYQGRRTTFDEFRKLLDTKQIRYNFDWH